MTKNKQENDIKKQTAHGIKGGNVSLEVDEEITNNAYEDDMQIQLDMERKNAENFKHMAIQLQADFDNYRKRNAQAVQVAKTDGIADAVKSILPAYDAVLGALKVIQDEKVKQGLEMVEREFLKAFKSLNIEVIPSLGEAFDPEFHNAIMVEEAEGIDSGTVLEEIQRGFKGPNGVIRYAMVKIAK